MNISVGGVIELQTAVTSSCGCLGKRLLIMNSLSRVSNVLGAEAPSLVDRSAGIDQ